MAGRQGGHSPPILSKPSVFGNFNVSSENVRTIAVGKDKVDNLPPNPPKIWWKIENTEEAQALS